MIVKRVGPDSFGSANRRASNPGGRSDSAADATSATGRGSRSGFSVNVVPSNAGVDTSVTANTLPAVYVLNASTWRPASTAAATSSGFNGTPCPSVHAHRSFPKSSDGHVTP